MDHQVENTPAANPLVSVIIPVRDHPAGVRRVLDYLAAQTLPPECFEVIVSDDGSRSELVPTMADGAGRVRLLSGPPRTSYAARNRAAGVARGSVLAFCDSDCLPDPAWLEQGLAAIAGADIVAGEVKFLRPPHPTVWSLLSADLFLDQRQNVTLSRGVTANLWVRRRCFNDLGGFDESLPSGGDYDFVQRAVERGARLRYAPLAVVAHPTVDGGRAFLRKIWETNLWGGVRSARRHDKPGLLGALIMAPIFGVVIARRRALRPALCLDRARLAASALRPRLRDDVLAVAALYSLVCYVAGAGRITGWLKGKRLARAGAGPTYSIPSDESMLARRRPPDAASWS